MFNKVESVEHAFQIMGFTLDINKFRESGLPEDRIQSTFDGILCEIVCEANNKINGDWKPDWSDGKWKYFVGHYIESDNEKDTGFGFSDTRYGFWGTGTSVGERLYVATSEQALYLGEKFKSLFESARLVYKKEDRNK